MSNDDCVLCIDWTSCPILITYLVSIQLQLGTEVALQSAPMPSLLIWSRSEKLHTTRNPHSTLHSSAAVIRQDPPISAELQKTKPATALGYDHIHIEFLKHLGPNALPWLAKFFSTCDRLHWHYANYPPSTVLLFGLTQVTQAWSMYSWTPPCNSYLVLYALLHFLGYQFSPTSNHQLSEGKLPQSG